MSLRQVTTGLSLVRRESHMSLLDIRHSSRGSTRGGKRLRSFDLAEDNALSTRGDHSTAVLAAAEEERSNIHDAVLAATEEKRSSTHKAELRHNREILRWSGRNRRQTLMINSAPSSTEVSTSLHHCIIPFLVFCFCDVFVLSTLFQI